jgi:hypothetical protein
MRDPRVWAMVLNLRQEWAADSQNRLPTPPRDQTSHQARTHNVRCGQTDPGPDRGEAPKTVAHAAETLAVELITRAVETTGDPNPYRRLTDLSRKLPPRIGIRLTLRDHGLLIEVWDSDKTPPQYMDAHLAVAGSMSLEWDCYQPRGGGKVIRADLGIPKPQQAITNLRLVRQVRRRGRRLGWWGWCRVGCVRWCRVGRCT